MSDDEVKRVAIEVVHNILSDQKVSVRLFFCRPPSESWPSFPGYVSVGKRHAGLVP